MDREIDYEGLMLELESVITPILKRAGLIKDDRPTEIGSWAFFCLRKPSTGRIALTGRCNAAIVEKLVKLSGVVLELDRQEKAEGN